MLSEFLVSLADSSPLIATEFKLKAIESNRLASIARWTIGLVDEFASATIPFGESFVNLVRPDTLQRHPQRHPGRLSVQVRTGLGFIDDYDVSGFSCLHKPYD